MNTKEFMAHMASEQRRMGFRNEDEFMQTAHNWKEMFGEDLPKDYYHPRDKCIIDAAVIGLTQMVSN